MSDTLDKIGFCGGFFQKAFDTSILQKFLTDFVILLASLAKSLSVSLRTKGLWVRIPLQLFKLQISHLFWAKSCLTFRQLHIVDLP